MAPSSRVSRFSILLLLSASQLLSGVVAYKQCYFPDGSIPTDLLWGACSSEGHSGCCDVRSGDICQPNGLCLYSSSSTNNTYRGTCTDRTWTDPACPNICTAGFEDEWIWTTPCSSKADGSDLTYACGFREQGSGRLASNCTASATKYTAGFNTQLTTSTKATRYTPPASPDTKVYSVYVESYTTKITALNDWTTITTTWESTVTSAIGYPSGILPSSSSNTITGTQGGLTSAPTSSTTSTGSALPQTSAPASSGPPAAILGGAVGGGVVVLALLAGVFFYLRKRRAIKSESGERIASPALPPHNGPVGSEQVVPYEVPGDGAFAPDKKYVYGAGSGSGNAGAYEMSNAGEKGWRSAGAGVAEVPAGDQRMGAYEMSGNGGEKRYPGAVEVSGDSRSPGGFSPGGVVSPMTPAPAYSGLNPAYAGAVEMDGSDYTPSRPTTSNGNVRGRNGVGNA